MATQENVCASSTTVEMLRISSRELPGTKKRRRRMKPVPLSPKKVEVRTVTETTSGMNERSEE